MKEIIVHSKKHGNKIALVDDEDFKILNKFKWRLQIGKNTCYACRTYPTGPLILSISMHRQIYGLSYGQKKVIDHINHNGLDNRKENIRVCTYAENAQNKTINNKGSSKFKGVHWSKQQQKWAASIGLNNKTYSLGFFEKEEDAALKYNRVAAKHHKEYANLNIL